MGLTDLQGVGPVTADRLVDAGVEGLPDVAALSEGELADVGAEVGVDAGTMRRWRDQAMMMVTREGLDDDDEMGPMSTALQSAHPPRDQHERQDLVRVRVLCEQGLLAGNAVWRGEVHEVRYWQYLLAVSEHEAGYELV